jgi:peptidoglycan lytic transglycosylase
MGMRRSLRLVAATAWLLFGACADRPPAQAHHVPRTPRGVGTLRGSDASSESDPEPIELEARPELSPDSADQPSRNISASGQQLAASYGGARALAVQRGSASYYSDALAGRSTASGAAYEPHGFTAAHRSLPFGTILRVTRSDGQKVVYVKVTDRGPYGPRGRILDLSRAAAEHLGMLRAGVIKIKLEVVEYGKARQPRKPRRRRR